MDRSTSQPDVTERNGLKFYGPDDKLPPGAVEALERRTVDELKAAAEKATRRS